MEVLPIFSHSMTFLWIYNGKTMERTYNLEWIYNSHCQNGSTSHIFPFYDFFYGYIMERQWNVPII